MPDNTIDDQQGASDGLSDARRASGKQVANLDEIKYRAEKMLYDLFYKGMEAGEDDVLQRQFDMELGYKIRYADRCIKSAKDELADILTALTDLQPSDPDTNSRQAEAHPQSTIDSEVGDLV